MQFVHRRSAGCKQGVARLLERRVLRHQQAMARHRREGNACLQLGIVAAAGAIEGVGPAPVEHVFALGVRLQIERKQAMNATIAIEHQMTRPPTGVCRSRTGLLQRRKEFVAGERMRIGGALRIGAGVPRRLADGGGRAGKPWCNLVARHNSSNTASTSTATLRGSEPAPTAARECRPASPNTSTIRSEAPSATSGCWAKPGTALTNTPSLTQRLMRSSSPPAARFSCASPLTAQSRAAALPSSSESSRPTVPTYLRPSGAAVTWPEMKTSLPLTT